MLDRIDEIVPPGVTLNEANARLGAPSPQRPEPAPPPGIRPLAA